MLPIGTPVRWRISGAARVFQPDDPLTREGFVLAQVPSFTDPITPLAAVLREFKAGELEVPPDLAQYMPYIAENALAFTSIRPYSTDTHITVAVNPLPNYPHDRWRGRTYWRQLTVHWVKKRLTDDDVIRTPIEWPKPVVRKRSYLSYDEHG